MSLPKLKVRKEFIDSFLELCALCSLILLIVYPLMKWSQLPDKIPIHFGLSGKPDNYADKIYILLLPLLGSILFIGFHIINKFPHTFNYPVKITEENAPRQYLLATRLMRYLMVFVTMTFLYIVWGSIQSALGNENGLGKYFIVIFCLTLFTIIIYYSIKSKSVK